METIKSFIFDKVFTKNNKNRINPAVSNYSWWESKGYQEEFRFILDYTNFLPEDSTISRRIYHVWYNINNIPTCKYCNIEQVKFRNFVKGYDDYCSVKYH